MVGGDNIEKYSFRNFVLVIIFISLVSCKGKNKTVNKADCIKLLVQETQKRSKVEKNQEKNSEFGEYYLKRFRKSL